MAMLIVQCDTCGNDIRKHHTRVGKNNFCNRNCYLEFHSVKKEIKNCEMCGIDFEVENKETQIVSAQEGVMMRIITYKTNLAHAQLAERIL